MNVEQEETFKNLHKRLNYLEVNHRDKTFNPTMFFKTAIQHKNVILISSAISTLTILYLYQKLNNN